MRIQIANNSSIYGRAVFAGRTMSLSGVVDQGEDICTLLGLAATATSRLEP